MCAPLRSPRAASTCAHARSLAPRNADASEPLRPEARSCQPSTQQSARGSLDRFCGESTLLVDLRIGRGRAEVVETDEGAARAEVLVPTLANAGLDGDARGHSRGQDGFAIG